MNEVIFNEENHTYADPGGRLYPSVTQVIDEARMIDLSMVNKEVLEYRAEEGGLIHWICEKHDLGELDQFNYDHEYDPYLEGWKMYLKDCQPVFLAIEFPMISTTLGFAGTPDRVYRCGSCGAGILDLKTGVPQPATGIQTGGYQILVEENLKIKVKERITVKLKPGGYQVFRHNDLQDVPNFRSALNVWKWRKNNKLIGR